MSLRDILQLPQFVSLTDDQALTLLLSDVNFPGDSTAYTWSGVGKKLLENGATASDYMNFTSNISTLPGGAALDKCLSSGGFDFSDAFNRATIVAQEVNEPAWAVSILTAMLAIGAPIVKKQWETMGLTAAPVLTDIQTTRATITQAQVMVDFAAVYNSVVNQLESGAITTLAQAKQAVSVA